MRFADYSFVRTWSECAFKGYLQYRRNLRPRDDAPYLRAGTALHRGFYDLHFNGWNLDSANAKMAEAWGGYKVAQASDWSHFTEGHLSLILDNYKRDWAGSSLAPLKLRMDDLNLSKLAHHELKIDAEGYVTFAETPLAVDMGDYVHAGLVDYPTVTGGTRNIMDWKTTSGNVTEYWAQKHAYSHQMRGYTLMMQEITGLDFAGAFIMGVHVGKMAGDDDDKWKRRTGSRSKLFGPFVYSKQQLEETKEWMRSWLKMIDYFDENEFYPAVGLGSELCKRCDFLPVCKTTPPLREGRIRQDFITRELTGVLASGADSDD